MKVTLDTNIYVSALQFGGKPMALLQMGLEGDIEIAISQAILDEAISVLREKFGWSVVDLREAVAAIDAVTYRVSTTETLDVVTADPADNRILECAVAAGSEKVVSGDGHMLTIGTFRGIEIVRVAEFLRRFEVRGR